MNKIFFAMATFFCFSLHAGQYVGVNLGLNNGVLTNQSHNDKVGFAVGANYGWKFDSNFRVEGEFKYRENHQKTDKLAGDNGLITKKSVEKYSLTYMVNVLYDIQQLQTQTIVPYVGIGIGYAQNTDQTSVRAVTSTTNKVRDNRLAYQAVAGIKMPINETLSVGAEYVYHAGKSHAKDHSLAMTLVRSF